MAASSAHLLLSQHASGQPPVGTTVVPPNDIEAWWDASTLATANGAAIADLWPAKSPQQAMTLGTDYLGATNAPVKINSSLVDGYPAVRFDGVNDNAYANGLLGPNAYSVALHFYAATDVANMRCLFIMDSMEIYINGPNWSVWDGAADTVGPVYVAGTHKVLFTCSMGGDWALWVDGSKIMSGSKGFAPGAGHLEVMSYYGDQRYLGGDLAQVVVWNHILTPQETADWFSTYPLVTTVTGTGALTVGAETLAGAGTVKLTGAGALTVGAEVLAGTGTLKLTGAGALTSAAAVVAGTGSASLTGSGALTITAPFLSSSGSVATPNIPGDGALTAPLSVLAGTGTLALTGASSLTVGTEVLSGTGAVRLSGAGSLTAGSSSLAGTGTLKVTSAGSLTPGAEVLTGTGAVRLTGTGALTPGTEVLTGSGSLTVTGSGSLSPQVALLSAAGTVTANPKTDTLTDDFTTLDTAKWFTSSASITVTGGRLQIPVTPAYDGLFTQNPNYSLRDSSFSVELVSYSPHTNNSEAQMGVSGSNGSLMIVVGYGVTIARVGANGTTDDTNVPYDPATHGRFLRIAESGGSVLFQRSLDAASWTTFRTVPTPSWVDSCQPRLIAGRWGGDPDSLSVWDNVNLIPAIVTGTGSLQSAPAVVSGSGTLRVTGAGSLTIGTEVLSGTGTSRLSGAGSLTAGAPSVAGTAAVRLTGAGALTGPSPTLAGTAAVRVTGAGALTSTGPALAGAGTSSLTGSGALTASPATLSGADVPFVGGSGGLVATSPVVTGSATLRITGANALPGIVPTLSASGIIRATGAGALVKSPASTLAGTGIVRVGGTGTPTANPATLAGTGTLYLTGSGALVITSPVLAGVAMVVMPGGPAPSYGYAELLSDGIGFAVLLSDGIGTAALFDNGEGAATLEPSEADATIVSVGGEGFAVLASDGRVFADIAPHLADATLQIY